MSKNRTKEQAREYGIRYREKYRAREKARKAAWYRENKAAIIQRKKARLNAPKTDRAKE